MENIKSLVSALQISTIKDFVKITETVTVTEIHDRIKMGKYKKEIDFIRPFFVCGRDEEGNDLKKKLPAFTASGVFTDSRKEENLVKYSQLIILDLDDLPKDIIQAIKSKAIAIPYTVLCFISPSGLGLKIAVLVDSGKEFHQGAYKQVVGYYANELDQDFDLQTKDIARQTYFSYDKDAYLNDTAKIFNVDLQKITRPKSDIMDHDCEDDPDFDLKFENVVRYTENKIQFEKGNRNNFIHLLGCNCSRFGLAINRVIESSFKRFANGFSKNEIKSAIRSAYKTNAHLFGSDADKLQYKPIGNNKHIAQYFDDNPFINTPTIPDFVVDNLPDFIRLLATSRECIRERDVIITTMLVILSGSLYNTFGRYDDSIVYPSLFSFIVAPPANGKGSMRMAREAFQEFNSKMEAESKVDLAEYYKAIKALKDGELEPIKPNSNSLFIAGNSSSAAIYEHLSNSAGRGIICESESDALGNILKNDWGNFSDILRSAFHHECISINRKGSKTIVELPKLATILTGTPSMVPIIIKSTEDGLFSRFIYYCFHGTLEWRYVGPKKRKDNLSLIKQLIKGNIYSIVSSINLKKQFVDLTDQQWQELNNHFEIKLKELTNLHSGEIAPTVKRMGLITYRFCLIFTAIRKYEENSWTKQIECSDLHFNMAIQLADVYLAHAVVMLKSLPKKHIANNKSGMMPLYESLPDNVLFSLQDAKRIAVDIGIFVHEKTIFNYLDKLIDSGHLVKERFGKYKKVLL